MAGSQTLARISTLTVDLDARTVETGGRVLCLSERELGVLELLIRRSIVGNSQARIALGMVSVNLDSRRAEIDSHPLPLTEKEYRILELLALRKGTTVSKEAILNHLYDGAGQPADIKIIDVFICRLRRKLAVATGGEAFIATVRGHGYVLRDPAGAANHRNGAEARFAER